MTRTRSGKKTKTQRPVSSCSQPRKATYKETQGEKVSPRDISTCPFETGAKTKTAVSPSGRVQGGRLTSERSKEVPSKRVENHDDENKEGIPMVSGVSNASPSQGGQDGLKGDCISGGAEGTGLGTKGEERGQDAKEGNPVVIRNSGDGSMCQKAGRILPGASAAAPRAQADGTGTSSSSSTSKRVTRPRRTSLAYLQRTRGHRRGIAKARTERKVREREEERERMRMTELEGMEVDERERVMKMIEEERRAREAARQKEVKRVKNRESVEKSRVREMVFEAEVGNEGDALRWENERMAGFLQWVKAEKLLRDVRKEFAARKRR